MDAEPPVMREDLPESGRYVIVFEGGSEAEMTFRKTAPGVIAIDHTYTPPELRGRNIAARLMSRAIDDARRDGVRIHPICSYVVAQFARHPEWADLRA